MAAFLLTVSCLAGKMCSAQNIVPAQNRALVINRTEYVDAKAMRCPKYTNWTLPPVYVQCRNHGMDFVACSVSEMTVDLSLALLLSSMLYIFMMYRRQVAWEALDDEDMADYNDPGDSRPLMLSRSSSSSSQAPTLLSSHGDFSKYVRGHRKDTGKFMHAHLGHLVAKHDEMGAKLDGVEKSEALWTSFGQMLGLLNLTIPSVSIVLQGVLKVGNNGHAAGEGEYVDHAGIHYRDYDLDECSRTYRQGCVAVFTIIAIVLQSVNKTFKPDTKAGELSEKKERLKKQKAQFEADLMLVGGKSEGDGHGEGK